MQESIVFLVRVQRRRKESSRSLSHLLMSFLFYFPLLLLIYKAAHALQCSAASWAIYKQDLFLFIYLENSRFHAYNKQTRQNKQVQHENRHLGSALTGASILLDYL